MLLENRQFTVIGAGGIGGVVGAHLVRAGCQVTFVEANLEHVQAIRRDGLRIVGQADLKVRAPALLPREVTSDLDVVLLAVKSKDTRAALQPVAANLLAEGFVVSLQNGLEEYTIARAVGEERTVGAFLTFGGHNAGPGEVVYGGPGSLRLGELDGALSGRVVALADLFTRAFHPAEATPNIFGYLWAKAALGAFYFATALVDEDVPRILDRTRYRPLFGSLVAEVVSVADAEGVACEVVDGFDPSAIASGNGVEASWEAQYRYWADHMQQRTGVWRDLAVHHQTTEVEHIIGPVIERAHARAVPVPLLEALRAQIQEAERGKRQLYFQNLDELAARFQPD